MSVPSNAIIFCPSSFILLGLPGLEQKHQWSSICFCSIYITALLVNAARPFLVKVVPVLHELTSFLVSMLGLTDIALSSSTLPQMLGTFCVRTRVISCASCLAQMFLTHVLCVVELGSLVVMAFDYVPICALLRYTSMLTDPLSLSWPNNLYRLVLSLAVIGFNLGCIFLSHTLIQLPSHGTRHKSFGTSGAHVGIIIIL
ncbi:olfactory receptor 52P1-like [Emydura macquarii macquarii]|uniref:olfactory receptor 52P1-like n=1 Tax=Emydura macquarii macquarii TaxID=1129001 RepID=UPI00352A4A45